MSPIPIIVLLASVVCVTSRSKQGPCSGAICAMACRCGFVLDIFGCEICECKTCPVCTCGKVYSECGSACPRTCKDVIYNPPVACPAVCVEGCFCPKGTVLIEKDSDHCVSEDECWTKYYY